MTSASPQAATAAAALPEAADAATGLGVGSLLMKATVTSGASRHVAAAVAAALFRLLAPDATKSESDPEIAARLLPISEALGVQASLGVSHLQQAEMVPGLPGSSRTQLRRLRRRRNEALHGGFGAAPRCASARDETDVSALHGAAAITPETVAHPAPPASDEMDDFELHEIHVATPEMIAHPNPPPGTRLVSSRSPRPPLR